jgi:hypothetical protein
MLGRYPALMRTAAKRMSWLASLTPRLVVKMLQAPNFRNMGRNLFFVQTVAAAIYSHVIKDYWVYVGYETVE